MTSRRLLAVDSSVVVAVIRKEQDHEFLREEMKSSDCVMSAMNRVEVETVIFAKRKEAGCQELHQLLVEVKMTIHPINEQMVQTAIESWKHYGTSGKHEAQLNMGDSFAYALSKELRAPLMCIGNDLSLIHI